jgi:hypothetical protein
MAALDTHCHRHCIDVHITRYNPTVMCVIVPWVTMKANAVQSCWNAPSSSLSHFLSFSFSCALYSALEKASYG